MCNKEERFNMGAQEKGREQYKVRLIGPYERSVAFT